MSSISISFMLYKYKCMEKKHTLRRGYISILNICIVSSHVDEYISVDKKQYTLLPVGKLKGSNANFYLYDLY